MQPANDRQSEHLPIKHEREPFVPLALVSLAPPLLWATHFAIVYLLEGFLCTRPSSMTNLIPGAIIGLTLVFAALCTWALIYGPRWLRRAGASRLQSQAFLAETQRLLAALSLIAIVWSGAGALLVGPCVVAY